MVFSAPLKIDDNGTLEYRVYLGMSEAGKWTIEVLKGENSSDIIHYKLDFDGFYRFHHIFVPEGFIFWRAVNHNGEIKLNGFLPSYTKKKEKLRVFFPEEGNINMGEYENLLNDPISEYNLLVLPGFKKFKNIEITEDGDCAHLVVHTWTGMNYKNPPKLNERWKHKTILLDYGDLPFIHFIGEYPVYFKRSHIWEDVIKFDYQISNNVHPLFYCIKENNGVTGLDFLPEQHKTFDIVCHLDPGTGGKRERVASFVQSLGNLGYKIHVGKSSDYSNPDIRREVDNEYFQQMRASKIIVTCNPNFWEGDFRLFEAITSGAVVFCDEMFNKPPGLENIVQWYDPNDLESLKNRIIHFLNNPREIYNLASRTRSVGIEKFLPEHLIKYILTKSSDLFPYVDLDWVLEQ